MLKLHDEIELKIEKMANEGKALGRYDNQVIFVPYACPGDVLKVKVTQKNKNFCEAEIVEILKPSEDRVSPPCKYYGFCGGCNFQHINYQKQLEIKNSLVHETLKKFLKKETLPFLSPVASPREFNYRNRIQLHKTQKQWGFYQRRSHDLLHIDSCLIAEDEINSYLLKLSEVNLPADLSKIELYLDSKLTAQYRLLDETTPSAFFSQVNRFQNKNLINAVLETISSIPEKLDTLYDLYAGSGNFALPLSQTAKAPECIYAVEMSPHLVAEGKAAIKNFTFPSKSKIHFIESPVEYFLRNSLVAPNALILLDPPRTGCHSEVISIMGSQPRKHIIYISCNYVTLARDLAALSETAKNWNLNIHFHAIQCFDMFPQTDHIEVLTYFSIS